VVEADTARYRPHRQPHLPQFLPQNLMHWRYYLPQIPQRNLGSCFCRTECLTHFHLSPTQNILFMTQLVLKLVVCAAVCYVLRQYLRPQQARGECTGGIPHGCSWVSPLGTLGGDGGFDHRMRRRDGSALMRRSCTSIFVPTPRFDREPWRGGRIFGVPGCRRQPTDGCPCVRPKESSSRSHSGLRELAHMIF
jgi:hypothetical protein